MSATLTRKHVADVAEFVDPVELRSHAGDPVARVFISFADGAQVEVSDQGRDVIVFILDALNSGREVNVEAEDELLTPAAAASVLGVTRQSVYRWQDDDLLPVVMRGRARAVPAAAVRALKAIRDSRASLNAADKMADEANAVAEHSDVKVDLFASVQEAVRRGRAGQAGQAWRTVRAAQVAAQAEHARDVFADDVAD